MPAVFLRHWGVRGHTQNMFMHVPGSMVVYICNKCVLMIVDMLRCTQLQELYFSQRELSICCVGYDWVPCKCHRAETLKKEHHAQSYSSTGGLHSTQLITPDFVIATS